MARAIAAKGTAEQPWLHLQPVLEAEQQWGNSSRDGFHYVMQNGEWMALMRRPLNVEGLRTAFDFPQHIHVGCSDNGDTWVVDAEHRVRIDAVNRSRPHGPARPTRTGLMAKILGP